MPEANELDILRPGDTCWRIERAGRLAVIVDAAPYFAVLRSVIQQARHSVIMIGWEFDTRISLDPRAQDDGSAPARQAPELGGPAEPRPEHLHAPMGYRNAPDAWPGFDAAPAHRLDGASRQITLKLDHAHPGATAHHQKIVVIDDVLAFCGGIDTTADRWDTRDHPDRSENRRRPTTGRHYGPWHDATVAVDGGRAGAGATRPRTLEARDGR
jgi:phospholipase D1/2